MALTVLNVAFPLAPVGPAAVGGAEQILTALDAALVRAGHRSLVLACEGSVTHGELHALPRPGDTLDHHFQPRLHQLVRERLAELLAREPIDIVHLHGIDCHAYLPPPGPAALVTLHLPASWHDRSLFHPTRPRTFLHGVSRSQHATFPASSALLSPIENGVAVDWPDGNARSLPVDVPADFVLTLGRICPEKGLHHALDAADRARVACVIGGRVFPFVAHQDYFAREVAPRLGERHRFIGALGPVEKRAWLRHARALLVPSTAPETSSLVAMEALACGTPVIAFAVGALPEIVEHGRTGFLVRDVAEMADAIAATSRIDRTLCRAVARERFSAARMTACYLDRYAELARSAAHRTDAAA